MRFDEAPPLVTGVLAALVGVNQQPRPRLSPPHGHQERLEHQVGAHPEQHRPADDLPRIQVHDDS